MPGLLGVGVAAGAGDGVGGVSAGGLALSAGVAGLDVTSLMRFSAAASQSGQIFLNSVSSSVSLVPAASFAAIASSLVLPHPSEGGNFISRRSPDFSLSRASRIATVSRASFHWSKTSRKWFCSAFGAIFMRIHRSRISRAVSSVHLSGGNSASSARIFASWSFSTTTSIALRRVSSLFFSCVSSAFCSAFIRSARSATSTLSFASCARSRSRIASRSSFDIGFNSHASITSFFLNRSLPGRPWSSDERSSAIDVSVTCVTVPVILRPNVLISRHTRIPGAMSATATGLDPAGPAALAAFGAPPGAAHDIDAASAITAHPARKRFMAQVSPYSVHRIAQRRYRQAGRVMFRESGSRKRRRKG